MIAFAFVAAQFFGFARTANAQRYLTEIVSEASAVERFSNDLSKFQSLVLNLKKRTQIRPDEKRQVDDSARGLKNNISSLQRNLRAILDKVKANDIDVEALVRDKVRNASLLSFIRTNGGAKAVLEKLVSQGNQLAVEIDDAAKDTPPAAGAAALHLENADQFNAIPAAYTPGSPALKNGRFFTCLVKTAAVIITAIRGKQLAEAEQSFDATCGSGAGTPTT